MLLLTGQPDSGKTTLLRSLIGHYPVQGFLSCKVFDGATLSRLELMLLPAGPLLPVAETTPFATELQTGRFYFHVQTFKEVAQHFSAPIADVPFIFDEFGLLELEGEGHAALFEHLPQEKLLVVVRSDLVAEFCQRYAVSQLLDIGDQSTAAKLAEWLSVSSS